jgi:hypothetical protein
VSIASAHSHSSFTLSNASLKVQAETQNFHISRHHKQLVVIDTFPARRHVVASWSKLVEV